MTDACLGPRPDLSLLASGRRGLKPCAALRMKGEHVTHGAVHRRRHADLGPEVDHATGEPLQLESLALLQVVVHRRRHFGRPAVEERHALFGVIRGQRDPMRAADGDGFARIGPIVWRMAVVAPDIATSATYFSQIERRISSLISALMPPRLQAS